MRPAGKLLFLLTALFASANVAATMSLDRMIIYFKSDQLPRQDVVVTNPDAENLYLQTEVYKVIRPGTEKEERVRISDPAALKLLTTPNKAVVPPKSRKTVRLVSLETPKDKELVYRVTFKPVVGELEATQNAIKLLVAYQALVFVRPQNPEYKLSGKIENGTITFTNSGNINVVLRNGRYCTSNKSGSCTKLDAGNRIYAGESWTLPLPEGAKKGQGYIQYGLFDGELEKAKKFPI